MQITALLHPFGRRGTGSAPSLYDVVAHADALPRSTPRVEIVAAEAITGTTRHPSTLTADFLPSADQRTTHWRHDFSRIQRALEELTVLPPVELLKVGERYFVVDGHKRVAAARRVGAVLDAIVVELYPPPADGFELRQRTAQPRCA
jgi:hypothetical protein